MAKEGDKAPELQEIAVPTLFIRHKVTDFNAWRKAFHEDCPFLQYALDSLNTWKHSILCRCYHFNTIFCAVAT